jgi:hypothetical protein
VKPKKHHFEQTHTNVPNNVGTEKLLKPIAEKNKKNPIPLEVHLRCHGKHWPTRTYTKLIENPPHDSNDSKGQRKCQGMVRAPEVCCVVDEH